MTNEEILKKFVEYLKEIYRKDYENNREFTTVDVKEEYPENFHYFKGKCNAIKLRIDLLDADLYKFLKIIDLED